MEKLKEKKTEWEERRNKVAQNKLMLENKSYRDYRSAVAESKKRMKQELTQD